MPKSSMHYCYLANSDDHGAKSCLKKYESRNAKFGCNMQQHGKQNQIIFLKIFQAGLLDNLLRLSPLLE